MQKRRFRRERLRDSSLDVRSSMKITLLTDIHGETKVRAAGSYNLRMPILTSLNEICPALALSIRSPRERSNTRIGSTRGELVYRALLLGTTNWRSAAL